MALKKLTKEGVRKLQPPVSGRLELYDTVAPGLCLRVTEKGSKSWSVVYKVSSEEVDKDKRSRKQHRLTIGKYPAMDLDDARTAANDAIKAAEKGDDPALLREQALTEKKHAKSNTIGRLVEDYFRREAEAKLKNWKTLKQKFEKHLAGWWDKPISSIHRRDAIEWGEEVLKKSGPGAEEEMLRRVKRLFNWAIENEITELNPFDRVKPKGTLTSRDRIMTDDELRAVWKAADRMGYPFGPIYKLLILTGQRRGDIAGLQRSWLIKDTIEIPSADYKTKKVQVVPLSKAAQDIIEELPRFNAGDFMFTTTSGRKAVAGFSKAAVKIKELSETKGWRVHDMRRTVRTNLPRLGVDKEIARRVIGHTDSGVDAIYDRYEYLDEKREALEVWAAEVEKILKKK